MSDTRLYYSLQRTFDYKIRNFPEEVYTFGRNDHLTNLMTTLLEDAGIGALKKIQTSARLSQRLGGTSFSDLDFFYGGLLAFNRLPEEMYSVNPFTDQLTSTEWNEVTIKDASYRERISKILQSMTYGGTVEGMRLAAEGASGYPCQILEGWRWTDGAGIGGTLGRFGNQPREFVVVPLVEQGTQLSNERRLSMYKALGQLKPANTIVTIDESGLGFHSPIQIQSVSADSEYFEVVKMVTGVDVPPPPPDAINFWLTDNQPVEAPTFAHLSTQESRMSLNESVASIDTFDLDTESGDRRVLPTNVTNPEQTWGPWRMIETADSPDNYPDGKYKGDPAKYRANGSYIFVWESQEAYVDWLTTFVATLGGQLQFDRYRFPVTVESLPSTITKPDDALAPTKVRIQTLFYGQG